MRYIAPELGETRIRSWFALKPVTIGRETRWLEQVTVLQTYAQVADGDFGAYSEAWSDTKFVDEEGGP